MHTTRIGDDAGEWVFVHSGDYSGVVSIYESPLDLNSKRLDIDIDTLVEFVGQVMQSRIVERIGGYSGTYTLQHLVRSLAGDPL